MIPPIDEFTGGLPPGDYPATLTEIEERFGLTPRRLWLLKGLREAVEAFWKAGITEVVIDGSFCTGKPDPGDIDGYWVEPDPGVYDRLDPYWLNFDLVLIPHSRKWKWPMWADKGIEFFIHPSMRASAEEAFPQFFRQDRDGNARGVVLIAKEKAQ